MGTLACLLLVYLFFYSAHSAIVWHSPAIRYEVSAMRSAVCVGWRPDNWRRESDRYCPAPGWYIAEVAVPDRIWWIRESALSAWIGVEVPLWLIILPLALPTISLWTNHIRRTRVRRRLAQGQCVHCAYDLKGNTGGACPECGYST